jgi:hypothetical protein
MRHGVKVQIVTAYRVSHWQRYGVTVRGNVTSEYPSLENEMGMACGTYGRRGAYIVWWVNMREEVGVERRIILEWIFKNWDGEAWAGLVRLIIGGDSGML